MTILLVPWQHPFAGTSRSRRRARFIPVPANAGSEITDQSSIRPSSTAAAANPQSSAAFSSQRSSQNHPRLQPLRRQIPIVGQALTAFPRVRSSEAFGRRPSGSVARVNAGRHPKPFTKADFRRNHRCLRVMGFVRH